MNKIRDQYTACPQYGMSFKKVIWSCKVHILVSKKIAFTSRHKRRNCILYYNYIFFKKSDGIWCIDWISCNYLTLVFHTSSHDYISNQVTIARHWSIKSHHMN